MTVAAKNKFEHLRANKQSREKKARTAPKKKSANPNSDFAKRQAADRAKWPNAWTKWKPDDDEKLQSEFKSGKTVNQIVKTLGRSPVSVALRIQKFFGEDAIDVEKVKTEQ
jgi:hypothetical protein